MANIKIHIGERWASFNQMRMVSTQVVDSDSDNKYASISNQRYKQQQ